MYASACVLQALLALQTTDTYSLSAGATACSSLDLQQLFDKTLLHFELWLMKQLLPQLTPPAAVLSAVDACMTMLQSVAGRAAELAVAGVDVAPVEAAVAAARQQIQAVMGQRQLQAAAEFALPADASAAAGAWRLPTGVLPKILPPALQQQGLEAAREREKSNIASVEFVPQGQSLSELLPQLLQLLAKYGTGPSSSVQHALRTTERALFRRAAAVFVQPVLTGSDVAVLARVVDSYRVALTAFKDSLSAGTLSMLRAELSSREVLSGWVAYCLTHQAAAAEHPLVLQYGVALDWQDLRHLTLTDSAATHAALGVAIYLKSHNRSGQELFHLSKQSPSLQFAEVYAAADSSMCSMLAHHVQAAIQSKAARWVKTQAKQREAAQLRRDIASLESERSSCSSELSYETYRSLQHNLLDRRISDIDCTLSSKRSQLRAAQTPLSPIKEPLPRGQRLAWRWLFFLHMPGLLRHLERSSCLAQQLLLPKPVPCNIWEEVQVTGLHTSLVSYYNEQQADNRHHIPSRSYQGSDGGPGFASIRSADTVPDKVGPDHIDSCYSEEDDVWSPDSLAATMAWQGSNCSADAMPALAPGIYSNPFAVTDTMAIVESFTAQLPNSLSSLQWAIYQYGSIEATAADRGNNGLASQNTMPDGLRKSEYLALTALRSFPNRQLHRLCDYLRGRELPLEHPAVQLVVQQTVFHLGQLTATASSSSGSAVAQFWRTGWDAPGGVLAALCFELQQLADELDNKHRDQGCVLLLGQLAAYLSDWHAPCKQVARQFAAMTTCCADTQLQQQVDVLVSQGPDEAQLAELKAKQTKWRAMALLCFAAGPLDSADVGAMLRLMLLIKHGDVYQPDRATAAELAALRVRCHDVMARRLPQLINELLMQPGLLTNAAASILECLQQQPGGPPPPHLPWRRLTSSSSGGPVASYQAVGSDGHLYSINVLDGTLLFDGNPPGRLPNTVLQHR